MLASFEHIVPQHPLTWRLTSIVEPEFASVWHFHPEFELTYVRQGLGTRLIGDSVGNYAPGDLALIGPEVPHTYVSTPGDAPHAAVVIQFRRDFLGPDFFTQPVFEPIARLLDRASRGLSFTSDGAALARLEQQSPPEQTVELLGLLLELSRSPAAPLASETGAPALSRASAARIEPMVALMHTGFASKLTLTDIAAAAHLVPTSASRLFSRCTGSTISLYLNVVRVNAACRLLRDSDLSIGTVATECGFANLSNFNRRFREVKSMTPRQYRNGFALP